MMRTRYDPEADAFHVRFAPDGLAIEETREVAPGVMIDLDAGGDVVGIEVPAVRLRGQATEPVKGETLDVD